MSRKEDGYIYIYKQDILDTRKIYKIGKAGDIFQRENDYKTIAPYGRMLFAFKCSNMSDREESLLTTLRLSYEVIGEVVYDIDFESLKNHIINTTATDSKSEDSNSSIPESDKVPIPRETLSCLTADYLRALSSIHGGYKGKKEEVLNFLLKNQLSISDVFKPDLQAFCNVHKLATTGKKSDLAHRLSIYYKQQGLVKDDVNLINL